MLLLLIHKIGVLLEHLVVASLGGLLQEMNGRRIVQMCIGTASHLVTSLTVKCDIRLKSKRIICCGMQGIDIIFNIFNGNSADTADRIGKIFINNLFVDTDCLEDLRSLVRLDRRNSHLSSDLDDTGNDCMVVIIDCCVIILIEHVLIHKLLNRILCKIWIDCAGTKAEQCCKMMYLTRLAGLQDQGQ